MTTTIVASPVPTSDRRRIWAALALWTAAALVFAASGALTALPRPFVPLFIWSPVVAAVVAWRRSPALRSFVGALDLRAAR